MVVIIGPESDKRRLTNTSRLTGCYLAMLARIVHAERSCHPCIDALTAAAAATGQSFCSTKYIKRRSAASHTHYVRCHH